MSSPDAPAPADLVARVAANYRELFRAMARVSPEGAIREQDGLLLVYTGPMLPLMNAAIVTRPPADPAAALARARSFFESRGQPWALTTITDAITEAMREAAIAGGREAGPSPIMLLTPLAGEPPTVPGLAIRVVEDPAALRRYNDTMTAGFGNEWACGAILDGWALLDMPDVTHYLGELDGQPVATAMRFTSHRIAGVVNVSTVPAARRRGIGEAMTWQAALDGRAEGCVASALDASDMGLPIYRRMGYRQVETYHLWLPRS